MWRTRSIFCALFLVACGRTPSTTTTASSTALIADAAAASDGSGSPTAADVVATSVAPAVQDAAVPAPHLAASCSAKSCSVRFSRDGLVIATTDGSHARFVDLATGATTEFAAPAGGRIAGLSATRRLVLVRGRGFSLRGADGAESPLSSKLVDASAASISEDGERLVMTQKHPGTSAGMGDASCPTAWLDLATSKVQPIALPGVAAGGSDQHCAWVRRRAVQMFQSRIAMAFSDYTAVARPGDSEVKGLYVLPNLFATDLQGKGKLLGADIDDGAHTVAVARIPAEPNLGKAPIVEIASVNGGKAPVKRWPVRGELLALWLSPDGSRLLMRTREAGATSLSVWDTKLGTKLGTLDFEWEGFEFSPDGKHLAVAAKGELRVVDLP